MNTCNVIKRLQAEEGVASIIEATLIMPLITLIVGALLYMGCYVVQAVTMYSYSQRMAVEAARVIAYPGYEKFGDLSNTVDFVSIESTSIQSIFGQDLNPYRYFSHSMLSDTQKTSMVKCVTRLVDDNAFIQSNASSCTIEATNNIFNRKVEVVVTKSLPVPDWLEFIGVDPNSMDLKVSAVAVTSDPSEFVRNTDMVFDVASFIADTFKIGNKTISEHIDVYKKKFSDMKAKFKVEA